MIKERVGQLDRSGWSGGSGGRVVRAGGWFAPAGTRGAPSRRPAPHSRGGVRIPPAVCELRLGRAEWRLGVCEVHLGRAESWRGCARSTWEGGVGAGGCARSTWEGGV